MQTRIFSNAALLRIENAAERRNFALLANRKQLSERIDDFGIFGNRNTEEIACATLAAASFAANKLL